MEETCHQTVVVPSLAHPRNDHQLIFPRNDGSLMLVWCEYYVTEPSSVFPDAFERRTTDGQPCRISGKLSFDRGRSWSDAFVLQDNFGKNNVKHPCLLRLPSDEILFFFTVWNDATDRRIYLKRSADECETWSEPIQISTHGGFHCINNDHALRLSSGRIVLPTFRAPEYMMGKENFEAFCFYSDDDGFSWRGSRGKVKLPKRGAEEPSLVELEDGTLFAVFRTTLGQVYKARSADGGDTWSPAEPTGLASPPSPPLVKQLPGSNDLLLVWNHAEASAHGQRNPLTSAVSKDKGESWTHIRDIENHEGHDSAYAAVTFLDDEALVTFYKCSKRLWLGTAVELKIYPISWFYGSN